MFCYDCGSKHITINFPGFFLSVFLFPQKEKYSLNWDANPPPPLKSPPTLFNISKEFNKEEVIAIGPARLRGVPTREQGMSLVPQFYPQAPFWINKLVIWNDHRFRLQNSPYFCVFKYEWAVKQKAAHALRACEARALRATLYRSLYWLWERKRLFCSLSSIFQKQKACPVEEAWTEQCIYSELRWICSIWKDIVFQAKIC